MTIDRDSLLPRYSKEKKWTQLPKELHEQITQVFTDAFKNQLKARDHFVVRSRLYKDEVILTVGLSKKNLLKQPQFHVSLAYNPKKDNLYQNVFFLVDCVATFVDEYFSGNEEDGEFPRTWKEFQLEGRTVYLSYTVENIELEKMANKLLGIDEEGSLVSGDDDDSERNSLKRALGISEDDES